MSVSIKFRCAQGELVDVETKLDALLAEMQGPKARVAMDRAFDLSPARPKRVAVRKRRRAKAG